MPAHIALMRLSLRSHPILRGRSVLLRPVVLAILLTVASTLPAKAASSSADVPHLHVQLILPESTLGHGQNAAGLYFKLEQGWHVYWKNAGDSGLPPRVKWTLPTEVTAGPLKFPPPKRLPLGPLMDFGYEGEVLFPFDLTVGPGTADGPTTLHGLVNWLVCREVCIPGKAELEVVKPVAASATKAAPGDSDASLYARLSGRLPSAQPPTFKAGFQATPSGFHLTVLTGNRESGAIFFPADAGILSNPAPQKFVALAKGFILDLKKDDALSSPPASMDGLIELAGGRSYEIAAVPGIPAQAATKAETPAPAPAIPGVPAAQSPGPATPASSPSPVAPAPAAPSPGLIRVAALAFLGGLILNLMPCVFPVLFLKGLALMQSGAEERGRLRNHGFVYTAGILVSFWILVGVLLILRGAGAHLGWGFQFQSPIFLTLMACLLFFLGMSLAGQFEIGLSLTSAGGSLAAKQGYTGSFFTGVLAVVVATPCTAPFMGLAIGYALAQPPLVTFAVFTALALGLAAPYVALTLQPAWTRALPRPGAWMEVLRQAVSVPIFATVIWLAWVLANAYGAALLAALLAAFLLIAIAGWFLGRWPAQRWATLVAVFIVVSVIALSVWAPSSLAGPAARQPVTRSEEWQPWNADSVAKFLAQGRPVFVDFTASWCLSCQVNERVALSKPEVRKAFADAHVALLRADWTQYEDAITQTLNGLGRSGVPAYALYLPGQSQPRLLPEVLTPGIVIDSLSQISASR